MSSAIVPLTSEWELNIQLGKAGFIKIDNNSLSCYVTGHFHMRDKYIFNFAIVIFKSIYQESEFQTQTWMKGFISSELVLFLLKVNFPRKT